MTNTIAISGNLTKDPEVRGSGKILAISIAHNERYKDSNGEYKDKVSFFDIVRFSTENYCNYVTKNLRKGMKVTVTGKLNQNRWEGQDGKMNYQVQVIANDIDFFFTQNQQGGQQQQQQQNNQQSYQNNPPPENQGQSNDNYNPESYYDQGNEQVEQGENFGSIYSENNKVTLDPY